MEFPLQDQLGRILENICPANHRIIKFTKEPAVGEMENFMSELSRIRVTTVDDTGASGETSLIQKVITSENSLIPGFLSQSECFKTEITVYSKIFEDINLILKKRKIHDDNIWPKCIAYSFKENVLILEDLKPKGFQMVDKKVGLNAEESLLAVRSMAKVHAWSKMLISSGKSYEDLGKTPAYARNLRFYGNYYSSGLKSLIRFIETNWSNREDWSSTADSLKLIFNNFQNDLKELSVMTSGVYDVFNMGDCWSNNILLKRENIKPVDIKFIDFQMSYINCFSWDLTYLLYMNVFPEVRLPLLEGLLEAYADSFSEALTVSGGDPSTVPTREIVRHEMDRLLLPALLFSVSHVELASVGGHGVEVLGDFKIEWFVNNRDRVKMDIEFFKSKGLLK